MPTIEELKRICGKKDTHMLTVLFYRRASIYLTKLLLKTNITANQTSLLSVIIVAIGGIFLASGDYWYSIIGALLVQLYMIVDCCDGNIARYMYGKKGSARGLFLEDACHNFIYPYICVCLSFGVYNIFQNVIVFLLGFLASLSYMAMHILEYLSTSQHYFSINSQISQSPKNQQGITFFLFRILNFFRKINENYDAFETILLLGAILNLLWLPLLLSCIVAPPIALMNFIMLFRTLPNPSKMRIMRK